MDIKKLTSLVENLDDEIISISLYRMMTNSVLLKSSAFFRLFPEQEYRQYSVKRSDIDGKKTYRFSVTVSRTTYSCFVGIGDTTIDIWNRYCK